jgi:DNA-binding PadR family transcriptional regulator
MSDRQEKQNTISSDLLRGHTETIVLGILHRGDAYGFEIYNTILECTGERYELKETTLYSSYKRLESEGCISSYWGDETRGARRRYYRLTDKGRETYLKNIKDWEFTRNILDDLMRIGTGKSAGKTKTAKRS